MRYPADKLAELYYHRRWSIELFFRDIKTTMHMEVMRTKTPAMIEKELLMNAITYNALRALILESAVAHQQELGGASASKARRTCCASGCRRRPPSMSSRASWRGGTPSCLKPSPACRTRRVQDDESHEPRNAAPSPINCSPHPASSSVKSPIANGIALRLK